WVIRVQMIVWKRPVVTHCGDTTTASAITRAALVRPTVTRARTTAGRRRVKRIPTSAIAPDPVTALPRVSATTVRSRLEPREAPWRERAGAPSVTAEYRKAAARPPLRNSGYLRRISESA